MGLSLRSFDSLRKFGTKAIGEVRKFGTKHGAEINKAADFLQKNALPTIEKVGRGVAEGAKVAAPIIGEINPTAGRIVGLVGRGAGMAAKAAGESNRAITKGRAALPQVNKIVSDVEAGNLAGAYGRGQKLQRTMMR